MSRIPESFIADLLDRLDIVEVIGQRLQMKRAGKEFHALCPFHDEKTPSFTISPQKQFYHCFGCGAHGTAIGFLMQYDGLEFVDAIEELARSIGVEVPREGGPAKPRTDGDLYGVLEEADQFFRRQLRNAPAAIEYLKERQVSGETARRFGLGFAPAQWSQLADALSAKGFTQDQLDRAGLLAGADDGRRYDRFRNRVMFPIADRRGRTIAFGGRAFGDDGPKYLNSPETSLFHKGRHLYGLTQALPESRASGEVLVVEGYMDVIALSQAGIGDVVATLGTALTSEHAEMLFRMAPHVICCFDGDAAGRRAAWRAVENLLARLREGRQASFLFLPQGEDPDSLVNRQGADAFNQLRANAVALSDYFFEHYAEQVDLHTLDGRSRLVALAKPALERIPEGSFRDLMFQRLARTAQLNRSLDAPNFSPRIGAPPPAAVRRTLVRSAISILLAQPELAERVSDLGPIRALSLPGSDLLAEMVEFLRERPNLKTGSVIELWPDPEQAQMLGKLAGAILLDDGTDLVAEFDDAIEALKRAYIRQRITQLQEQQTRTGLDTEEKNELRSCLNALASAP